MCSGGYPAPCGTSMTTRRHPRHAPCRRFQRKYMVHSPQCGDHRSAARRNHPHGTPGGIHARRRQRAIDAGRRRYGPPHGMMSLRHLPTRWIVSVSTCAMRRGMAPPACIDRALTSSAVNPTWGPMRVVAVRSAAVISALRTVDQSVALKTAARCVSGVATCCRRCATRRRIAATAHVRGCPVAPCPINSPIYNMD